MKEKILITVVLSSLITGSILLVNNKEISDTEIKDYIKTSLISGCKPIVDVCTSDCNKPIKYEGSPECLKNGVIRAKPERVSDLYLEIGKEVGVKDFDLVKLPEKIRTELGKTTTLEPIKESLVGVTIEAIKEDIPLEDNPIKDEIQPN